MPTYEYFCQTNNQHVEVLHSMNSTLNTWGELCACAGIEFGDTPAESSVEKQFSSVSLLPKKDIQMNYGGGCCGGGCGRGH